MLILGLPLKLFATGLGLAFTVSQLYHYLIRFMMHITILMLDGRASASNLGIFMDFNQILHAFFCMI